MRPAPLPLDLGSFTHDLTGNGNTLAMLPMNKTTKTKQSNEQKVSLLQGKCLTMLRHMKTYT